MAPITGANNPLSIGAAVALDLARAGVQVALTYQRVVSSTSESGADVLGRAFYDLQRTKPADEVVATIRAAGGSCVACEADLSQPDTPSALFDWAERALGPVEILINCAAHCAMEGDDIFSISASVLSRTFDVNVRAATLLMAEFAARHRRRNAT